MPTPKRPYFIQACYDWICDNQFIPYVVVNAEHNGVYVPKDYVENGRIVLNISSEAVENFSMTKRMISFKAEFDEPVGVQRIVLPINSILAIYAEENKQGIFFEETNVESEQEHFDSKESPKFTVVDP